ncbi:hypothetical protein GJ496_002833, partial [Pomphorhynchus laevis]
FSCSTISAKDEKEVFFSSPLANSTPIKGKKSHSTDRTILVDDSLCSENESLLNIELIMDDPPLGWGPPNAFSRPPFSLENEKSDFRQMFENKKFSNAKNHNNEGEDESMYGDNSDLPILFQGPEIMLEMENTSAMDVSCNLEKIKPEENVPFEDLSNKNKIISVRNQNIVADKKNLPDEVKIKNPRTNRKTERKNTRRNQENELSDNQITALNVEMKRPLRRSARIQNKLEKLNHQINQQAGRIGIAKKR